MLQIPEQQQWSKFHFSEHFQFGLFMTEAFDSNYEQLSYLPTVHEWWENTTTLKGVPLKALRTLISLVAWEIWNEKNCRTF